MFAQLRGEPSWAPFTLLLVEKAWTLGSDLGSDPSSVPSDGVNLGESLGLGLCNWKRGDNNTKLPEV